MIHPYSQPFEALRSSKSLGRRWAWCPRRNKSSAVRLRLPSKPFPACARSPFTLPRDSVALLFECDCFQSGKMTATRNPLNDRAAFEMPPFSHVFHSSFFVPFLAYFAFFRLAGLFVKNFMWQSYTGFKKYRLQNLSVCLLHSLISGLWSTIFFLTHVREMFENVIHWYEPWAAHLPILSIAYFLHDALDMLNHEWSRWTLELLIHHIATCFALLSGLLPQKFLLCNYWALLMEGNSIFLHTRTIMQISGLALQQPDAFKRIVQCNVIS
ncbi:hypothetical protein Y032_0060g3136 [Ancylostoma ceylanicum]|nr:hypothetical protein Y032_0060g3136 [Ancylostoma ceylanicum]